MKDKYHKLLPRTTGNNKTTTSVKQITNNLLIKTKVTEKKLLTICCKELDTIILHYRKTQNGKILTISRAPRNAPQRMLE